MPKLAEKQHPENIYLEPQSKLLSSSASTRGAAILLAKLVTRGNLCDEIKLTGFIKF